MFHVSSTIQVYALVVEIAGRLRMNTNLEKDADFPGVLRDFIIIQTTNKNDFTRLKFDLSQFQ